MKFIISSNTLLKGLQNISGILSANSLIPIIENFLFEIEDDIIKVTATDNETRATVSLKPDMVEGNGSIAIPPKILLNTLKTLPDVPLTVQINEDNFAVELIAGEGVYKVAGYNPNDYPELALIENATQIALNSVVLHNAINSTIFACTTDELRPQLMGVFFEMSPEYTNFVATDAHKLVRFRRSDIKVDEYISFIVHKKPLNLLKNLLVNLDADVSLQFNNTNVSFSFEDYTLTCRLLEGKFPDHEKVIPPGNDNEMLINREALLNTLKRVAIFASQASNQVKLAIKGQELTIHAEDTDYSNEAKERIPCSYKGDDMEIGFNSKFLIDILSTIESENVRFLMSEPNRAALIHPEENISEEEDILMLLMPVMLNA
jgi:DNA polymerase-3 subunit beta